MPPACETPIDPRARIAPGVEIGPYCTVGPDVSIDAGTRLIGNVALMGRVTIGKGNVLYPGVVIGGEPQDLHDTGAESDVVIGDHNVIRESVTIHRGSDTRRGTTTIGSSCYLMACSHVGHDARLGHHVVLVNGVLLGAEVHVLDHATVSGGSVVHPRTTIGEYSFVGGLSRITHDVPPYLVVESEGPTPRAVDVNTVALRRNAFTKDVIAAITEAHRLLYRGQVGPDEAREILRRRGQLVPQVNQLLSFVQMQQEGHHGRAREGIRSAA